MNIVNLLFENQDLKYKEFTSKLVPNVSFDSIIGVRTPILRSIVKSLSIEDKKKFLNDLPHKYHEENVLHSLILSNYTKDINVLLDKLDIFLPYMNSWAVTDIVSPKLFKKYPNIVLDKIKKWLKSEHEYTVRFGVVSLLQFFLDENFDESILHFVSEIKRDEYYIKMAIAWFYSFALIKQYDSCIKLFENKELDKWIHNKSIQKATESYRINDDIKVYLKSLKIK